MAKKGYIDDSLKETRNVSQVSDLYNFILVLLSRR